MGSLRTQPGSAHRERNMAAEQRARRVGPPRFMFYGLLGTINGLAAPNLLTPDSYLATRTNSGWVATFPGLDDDYGIPSGKECSDSHEPASNTTSTVRNRRMRIGGLPLRRAGQIRRTGCPRSRTSSPGQTNTKASGAPRPTSRTSPSRRDDAKASSVNRIPASHSPSTARRPAPARPTTTTSSTAPSN